jgi:hypothetical protein
VKTVACPSARQVTFDPLNELVAAAHRPVARYEHVQRHERAASGTPRAKRMELHLGRGVGAQDLVDACQFVLGQRAFHQPAGRAPQERHPGSNDVRRHDQRDHGIDDVQAGERHGPDAEDDADRRPHIGDQVPAIGFERQRVMLSADADQPSSDREMISEAATEAVRPMRASVIGCGDWSRSTADTLIVSAASRMSAASMPARDSRPSRARRCGPRPAVVPPTARRPGRRSQRPG